MFKKRRVLIFSGPSLKLREVRGFKAKLIASSLLGGCAFLILLLIVNHLSSDFLGLGYDRLAVLNAENRVLKQHLQDLTSKLGNLEQGVEKIADRGNELRLLVDLSAIDDDTRKAAVGGTEQRNEFSFLSSDAADILTGAHKMMDQLEREVRLQRASYEDIHQRYEYNTKFFSHLPAIKPMQGYYNVHGFGMRVHPVLRVYRMHEGIDIISDVGTQVFAAADGVVRYAGRTQGGYGVVVDISHGYGYSTLYAHLSKVHVSPGRTVKRGDLIGKSGRTGLVSGPHLHYEIRLNGRKQNPVDYFFDDVDAARYRTQLASHQ